MGPAALVVKRARAGIGLLLTILVLAAGTTAIIAGTLGYSEASATTAARQALSGADPTEAGIRVQTRLAEDPAAQEDAAQGIIEDAFAPTNVLTQRTIVSEPRTVADQEGRLIVLAGAALTSEDTDFTDRIEVVEGTWPTAAEDTGDGQETGDAQDTGATEDTGDTVQGALHAGAAQSWEIAVGDQLDVSGTTVQVTALWRPVDPQAAFWFGNPMVESGTDGTEHGPLIVPAVSADSFGSTPFVQFTVQPDPEQVLPADMPRLAAVAGTLDRELRTPEVEVRGVTVEGDLAPTAEAASLNLATARALNLVPVTLLLLVSLIAILQIARLQSQARSGEVELLIARGASRIQLLTWAVLEAVVVAVVAGALGIAGALGVMQVVPAGDLQTGIVVRTGLLAGLAVLLALVVVAVLQVRTLAARTATDRSGRTRTAAALGTMVLTLGAAALTWWQLQRYGSPLVTEPDGTLRTDLVAGAAPALLLAAAALLTTVILGPVGRFVETLSRRSRGLLTHLTAAQVSRRIVVYAVPVVLTVLAVGATTVAGLYAGTSAHLRENIAALSRGADIRAVPATSPAPATTLPAVPTLRGVDGVTESAPVWLADGRFGSSVVTATVLPVDRLGEVAVIPEGVLDTATVADALRGPIQPAAALPLPETATGLDLTVDLTVTPPDMATLQEQADHTYSWSRDQYTEGIAEDDLDLVDDGFLDQFGREQVELELEGFLSEAEVTSVLWFWDESSHTLLRVEAPPVPVAFDVSLSDPPGSPTITAGPSDSSRTVEIPVEPGPGRSLVGVDLGLPQFSQLYDFEIGLSSLTTTGDDGTDLLANEAVADWETSAPAALPEDVAEHENTPTVATLGDGPGLEVSGTTGQVFAGSLGRRADSAVLELRAPAAGGTTATRPAPEGPDAGADSTGDPGATTDPAAGTDPGADPGDEPGAEPGDEPGTSTEPGAVAGPAIPLAITGSLADTGNIELGARVTVQAFGQALPGEVAAIIDAVPGSTAPHTVLMDSAAFSSYLAASDSTLGSPHQLWAASADPEAALPAVQEAPGVASATGPGSVAVTDAASAVRLVFWVASAGAVLLAVTGIAAVAANLLGVRRPEVAVLRALGMTPGGQARARAAELLSVIAASLGLGLLAGWLVGWLVVPELARSTTLAGQVQLAAPLVLEVPLWAGMLVVLVGAVLALLAVQYLTVRNQALDTEYREEIR